MTGLEPARVLENFLRSLALRPGLTVVDVASGRGTMAAALTRWGVSVVAVDPAPPPRNDPSMAGVSWVRAEADAIPLSDASADRVVCRYGAHHLTRLSTSVAEWVRVLKPGGRLGLLDITAPSGLRAAAAAVERSRDPQLVRLLTPEEWWTLLAQAGLGPRRLGLTVEHVGLAVWLGGVEPAIASGRRALEHLAAVPEPLIDAVCDTDGMRRFTLWIVAEKPRR